MKSNIRFSFVDAIEKSHHSLESFSRRFQQVSHSSHPLHVTAARPLPTTLCDLQTLFYLIIKFQWIKLQDKWYANRVLKNDNQRLAATPSSGKHFQPTLLRPYNGMKIIYLEPRVHTPSAYKTFDNVVRKKKKRGKYSLEIRVIKRAIYTRKNNWRD